MLSTSIIHGINKHHTWNQQASYMESTSIIYGINTHHTWNQQASSMESTSIIHGINKHHVINKHQECYSIIDNIALLIATFKRYALVLFELVIVLLRKEKGNIVMDPPPLILIPYFFCTFTRDLVGPPPPLKGIFPSI